MLGAPPGLGAQAVTLEIQTPVLQQMEDGPAMPGKPGYAGGETLFFACLVSGYGKDVKENIALDWKIEAVDDQGVALTKPVAGKIAEELAPEDKEWKPKIRYSFELPYTAVCGDCRIRVAVTDRMSKLSATVEKAFTIRSRAVEPSEALTVRNFRFLRREDDSEPLATASYRSGDELWARFEITGFRYGDGNKVHVDYGLSVFRPSGKLLYQEPNAATAEESSFYPKRWVPGVLNLRLQGLAAGEYPIQLEVRDRIGNQKYEQRVTFRVE